MRISGSPAELELHRWANDWISTNEVSNPHEPREKSGALKAGIISPSRCLFDGEEIERLRADRDRSLDDWADGKTPSTGLFWRIWALRTIHTTAGAEVGFLHRLRSLAGAAALPRAVAATEQP